MTRGGGSRSRRSRDQGAERGGWAPLAPPCEAPARPGTRPPRCSPARLRRVAAAAAAAAMSPGKPGAGGAGTRRTGWRRRRRRRRLEAATRAPGLGRTAGPDSRVPGTFQGARGMKQAAREARPPPRSPRLRWALPPLLLLLRLGQVSWVGPGGGGARGGWGRDWQPLHLPGCALPAGIGGGGGGSASSGPPAAGGRPRAPATEPFPRLPRTRGRVVGFGVPGARSLPVAGPARAAGRLWPGPDPSWSHLAGAGPARQPEAAGGGVFAEGSRRGAGRAWPSRSRPPTRPAGARGAGPKGSGGGRGEPGQSRAPGGGQWERRGASGQRALLLGKVPSLGRRWPLAGVPPGDGPLPGEAACFPGCLIRALWAPAPSPPPPPCFLASLFR